MTQLRRVLFLPDLVLLILTTVIGAGIFLVPGTVLSQVQGHLTVGLIAWLFGGILSLLGALTYGELSAMHPKAGGLYVYIRECFGPLPAFLFGLALFLAIGNGSIATLAVALSDNLKGAFDLNPSMCRILSTAMIIALAWINVRGARQSATLQNYMTLLKLGALILMSGLFLWFGRGFQAAEFSLGLGQLDTSFLTGVGLAMIGVLWAYEGWQHGTYSAGEAINAQAIYPKAYLIGIATMIVVYILVNTSYIAALGPAGVMESSSVAADSMVAIGSSSGARLMALIIAISIFSAANGILLTTSRVTFAMAADGLFFRALSHVHPRFATPSYAIIAGCCWAALLAQFATFQQLLTYVVFTGWIFYALGAATIFVYRRRIAPADIPYKVPGYPWTPAIFVLVSVLIVMNHLSQNPISSSLALGITLIGIPTYWIWHGRRAAQKAKR
jgi:APA family basic amino acid/polyamine antiporter